MDKEVKTFDNDIVKSRVEINLKITSAMKKKERMVKKLKARLGIEDNKEDNDEEEVEEQGLVALNQGLGEDNDEEGAEKEKTEEVEKAPKVEKKRKAKIEPTTRPQQKGVKQNLAKLSAPTRVATREATLKAKEQAKEKAKEAKQGGS